MMSRTNLLRVVALLGFSTLMRAGTEAPQDEVQHAVERFLTAFNNLDWAAFRRCWSPDATVFLPPVPGIMTSPDRARQISSVSADGVWQELFESVRRRSGRTSPPFQTIQPKDLQIRIIGESAAIVTFWLGNDKSVGRRTITWQRTAGGWKIVHLHASTVEF